MLYSKLIIYYFSGTGNAKMVSEWISGKANCLNIETEIYSIDDKTKLKIYQPEVKTLIGFCSPTHGFNMPPIMLKFISEFPKLKNCDVFVLNTRAGMKLYKLFLPGLSGGALFIPAIILRLKGFKIRGYRQIDMPSNWISIHPGIRRKVVDSIHQRCKRISEKFTGKIFSGKKIYRGLFSLPVDIAILPISFGYYFVGRFMLAKTFIATYKCNNCGICEKQCPVNAIKNSKKQPYWTFNCESCMRCMNNCPIQAIETPHTWVIILWWLIFSIAPFWMLNYLGNLLNLNPDKLIFEIIEWIVMTALAFGLSYLSYIFLHFLMRFKFFNYLITFTSLTKLPFWRRYTAYHKKKNCI